LGIFFWNYSQPPSLFSEKQKNPETKIEKNIKQADLKKMVKEYELCKP